MPKELLSLSTLDPERPVIEIDGSRYECAVPEDFGAVQHTRFERLFRKVQQMQQPSEGETDEQAEERAQEAEDACRKAVAIILPELPPSTADRLRLVQLFSILQVYTDFMQAAGITRKLNPLPTSTGARSRRASKGSTAATPQGG